MKVLVIHTAENADQKTRILLLLEEMKIDTLCFPLSFSGEKDLELFNTFFDKSNIDKDFEKDILPGYILVISSLGGNWFDFLAGFSRCCRIPILVFGQDAISGISHEFSSCFSFINDEASLTTYLEYEVEAFKKQEAAREIIKAQNRLLKMGVPVTGEALCQCVIEGKVEELSLFIAAGFSPDARNKSGIPLLNLAARNDRREIIKYLLMINAELNIVSEDRGTTALIDSVMAKKYDLMMDLLKAGINVNAVSKDGQTALVVAVGIGDEKTIISLLEAGSDPDIQDSMGMSARQYALLFYKDKLGKFFEGREDGVPA